MGRGDGTLNIAVIPYDSGEVQFRYSRYLSPDRTQWIRHGLFVFYHKSGQVGSEGEYEDGVEVGIWRDYYENGQIAAEGQYDNGQEQGIWKFWLSDGTPEPDILYEHGVPVNS